MHEFKNKTELEFKEIKKELRQHDNRLVSTEAKLA
jgi:hypothetical protein